MGKYIDAEKLIRKIKEEWDMQELYLPTHFIDFVEEQKAAFEAEKVIEAIDKKSFDYYTPSGYAVDMGDVAEVIRRECGKKEDACKEKEDTCKWEKYRIINGIQVYKTSCSQQFVKKYKFCPYCRREVEEVGEANV